MSSPDSAKLCNSDLESQTPSVTFDDDYKDFPTPNSEDLAPPSSDNECVLDSAEFDGASSIGSCKSHSERKGHPEMTKQPEEQPQKTKKRLRMLDEDADAVRIKVIPDFRKRVPRNTGPCFSIGIACFLTIFSQLCTMLL